MPPVPSAPAPSSPTPSVRRRARPNFFSRNLFRSSARRQQSALETFPTSDRDNSFFPAEDSGSFFSTYLLHRHRHRDNPRAPSPHLKPIYIYPGLLRIVRDKAIALDNQCPAVLYKCRECRRDSRSPSTASSSRAPSDEPHTDPSSKEGDPAVGDDPASSSLEFSCPHQYSCPICLEEFHGKDLVRKLPCNVNHVFHSKCILDWFISHHRCPLCNEPVISPSIHPNIVAPRQRQSRTDPSQMSQGVLVLRNERGRSRSHVRLHRPRSVSFSQQSDTQFDDTDRSRVDAPPEASQTPVEGDVEEGEEGADTKASQERGKGSKRSRGPRTYSYIVHDNVRMEMNPVIPV